MVHQERGCDIEGVRASEGRCRHRVNDKLGMWFVPAECEALAGHGLGGLGEEEESE